MHRTHPAYYRKAQLACLDALKRLLADTLGDAADAVGYANEGRFDAAAGTLLGSHDRLKQAATLWEAVLVLHRAADRTTDKGEE